MSSATRVFVAPPAILGGEQARPFTIDKAAWIWAPDTPPEQPSAARFVNRFSVDAAARVVVHVSADQRFRLELDGKTVARGPHRGDLAHWAFSSHELDLEPGEHVLAADVVWMANHAPYAQLTWRPGFLFAAEGPLEAALDTGRGAWRVQTLPAYGYLKEKEIFSCFTGEALRYDGRLAPGPATDPVVVRVPQHDGFFYGEKRPGWQTWPSPLPDLIDRPVPGGRVRAVIPGGLAAGDPVTEAMTKHPDVPVWQAMLDAPDGRAPVAIPAGQTLSVVIDLEDYYVAYAGLAMDGAPGVQAEMAWAESFIHPDGTPKAGFKGNRDELLGKIYFGLQRDVFIHGPSPDGACGPRRYESVCWRAGRYVLLTITGSPDGDGAVAALACRETRYPFEPEAAFAAPEALVTEPTALMVRGLQNCSLETYVDCPHYEQLQYVGDSRITLLLTYALSTDDRLARRALELFEWSRGPDGLAAERYPSRTPQESTTYGLLWPCCVRDFLFWRDDPAWVLKRRPMVRSSLEGALAFLGDDGLFHTLPGWSFVDWVKSWKDGRAPDGDRGSLVNLHLLMALHAAADIEEATDDALMAGRWRGEALRLAERIVETFWDEKRGLLADDRARTLFSEHAQCLALLENALPADKAERAWNGLLTAPDLARASVYFSFYLFEAMARRGRGDLILGKMPYWRDMARDGFKTPMEHPEPARSDCHAWGSHPLFHFHASLAGVRPAAPGFRKVRVAPSPGGLPWIRAKLPHPKGTIEVDLNFTDRAAKGRINLPPDTEGEFVYATRTRPLRPGLNEL